MSWLQRFARTGTQAPGIALVRVAVGLVFLTSGLLKFLYANQGVLRFARLGLPGAMAYGVGAVEVVAGALVAIGLWTRIAALPLVIDMCVAIALTKLPLLWGNGPEPISAPPRAGLWAFAYQARLDITMLLSCLYLALAGFHVRSRSSDGVATHPHGEPQPAR